jgi:hypothetical protein
MNTSTIKAIALFDWTNQRVLVRTKEDGQDRIEWVEMREVYVNPQIPNDRLLDF